MCFVFSESVPSRRNRNAMCIKSVDPALNLFSRSSLLKRQRIVLRAFYMYVGVSREEEGMCG